MQSYAEVRNALWKSDTIIDRFVDLPAVSETAMENPLLFLDKLDKLVLDYRYELERVHKIFLGNGLDLLRSHIPLVDYPGIYSTYQSRLLGSSFDSVFQNQLIFFAELYDDLQNELDAFKVGNISLRPKGPHSFLMLFENEASDPNIQNSHYASIHMNVDIDVNSTMYDAAITDLSTKSGVPENTIREGGIFGQYQYKLLACYRFGNFRDHFLSYLKKLYRRSLHIHNFITFCSEYDWINQPIEIFRYGGMILNREVSGVIFKYLVSQELNDQGFALLAEFTEFRSTVPRQLLTDIKHVNIEVPMALEALNSVRLSLAPGVVIPPNAGTEDLVSVENTSQSTVLVNTLDGTREVLRLLPGEKDVLTVGDFIQPVGFALE